tara:strand:- start:843 stop:1019 length:177 start_codon:yes stop_codon:yes gene_type:complete
MNEINKKRQRNIVEQSKFLAKLKLLRREGKNKLLMERLSGWIEQHVDHKYQKDLRCME